MQARGFTLVELMVVVAIIAILAAVAFPNYTEYVAKARRADAKSVLLEGAQYMERIYTERGAYNRTSAGATATTLAAIGFPTALTGAPKDNASKNYNISLSGNLSGDAWTLQAVPTGAQAGDKCGTFTLTHAGVKDVTGASASAAICWN